MQKKEIEKIYKEYLAVQECIQEKWSKVFFYNLLKDKSVFFISINNPINGYLIARKIIDEYEILSLATDISRRRKGIGSQLLSELLILAKKEKIKRIILEVDRDNIAAVRLYKKSGFKIISKRSNYYNRLGKVSDAYIMKKIIY